MNATAHRSPATPDKPDAAARTAWWVLCAPALALAATCMLVPAGAPGDWIGAAWLLAVLWTIAASFVQTLRAGLCHGDWSAFAGEASPRDRASCTDDNDHDHFFRSGSYAYRRIRDEHEMLSRVGDRYIENRDRAGSLG